MTADPWKVLLVSWEAWDDWALKMSEPNARRPTEWSGIEEALAMEAACRAVAGVLGMSVTDLREELSALRRTAMTREQVVTEMKSRILTEEMHGDHEG